jgi:hypothetical protein
MNMLIPIRFPRTLEFEADRVAMPILPPRVPAAKETAALARKLGMSGPVVDEGPLYSVRSEEAVLHHFHASDSLRWCLLPTRGRTHRAKALDIHDEPGLRNIAEKFLAGLGIVDPESSFLSVTHGTRATAEAPSTAPSSVITSAYVNFSYTIEGLPVVGPGAKAQVEIGPGGTIVGCHRFWRSMTRGATPPPREHRPIISWRTAQKVFRCDPAFAQLDASAEVVVDRARLAYMAMPPRDVQGVLFPVYEMRGRVSTPKIERTPFRRYVVAIDYSADDLKKYRVVNRSFGGPCRVL